jgi:ribosomal protein S18 acetylase RimI-like enzyme
LTSGANEVIIVKAISANIDAIKQIADAHRNELGFIRKSTLLKAIERSEVFIAKRNNNVVGFVECRHRLDEQTTLSNIAVTAECYQMGIGRKLVEALVTEAKEREKEYILLKCPEELTANEFYRAMNFQLYKVEPGNRRKLKIWRWLL